MRNFIYLLQTSWIDVSDLTLMDIEISLRASAMDGNLQTHLSAAERSGFQLPKT